MPGPEASDQHWERLARYLTGEASPAEQAEVDAWLAEDPARRATLAALGDAIRPLAHAGDPDLDVTAALARVHERLDQESGVRPIRSAPSSARRPVWRNRAFQLAAAVVLLLGANLLVQRLQQPTPAGPVTADRIYRTPVGDADTIQLADGSTVVLAPASRLVVRAGYGEPDRNLELEGVAWFDVRHDPGRAFNVRAGEVLVRDLGTSFTVWADPAQPVSVAVTAGAVQVAADSDLGASVILKAGQRGTVAGDVVVAGFLAEDAALGWTRGRLVFVDAPFARVAAELHRWFGATLVAGDATVAARHLTSEFEGDSLNDVLAVLALALDARTEVRGDTVVLHTVR